MTMGSEHPEVREMMKNIRAKEAGWKKIGKVVSIIGVLQMASSGMVLFLLNIPALSLNEFLAINLVIGMILTGAGMGICSAPPGSGVWH